MNRSLRTAYSLIPYRSTETRNTGAQAPKPKHLFHPVLRIVLLGRTGNHLFQYALGRVLAEKHGVPLVLDGRGSMRRAGRRFRIFSNCRSRRRWCGAVRSARGPCVKLTGKHYWEYRGVPVLREAADDQSFDRAFSGCPADCMLFGYFQSPLYFESIADTLRAELKRLLAGAVRSPGADPAQPNSGITELRGGACAARRLSDSSGFPGLRHGLLSGIDPQDARTACRARAFSFSRTIRSGAADEFRDADQEVIDSGAAGSQSTSRSASDEPGVATTSSPTAPIRGGRHGWVTSPANR